MSDLMGLPVVTLPGARRAGRVEDLVLDPAGRQVRGLLIARDGWLRSAQAVAWSDLVRLGRDAVIARGTPGPAPPGLLWSRLAGKPLLTDAGEEVGLLADLDLDPGGRVVGYRVSSGVLDDLLSGQIRMPGSADLQPGSDVILVSGPVVEGQGPAAPGQEGEHALS